MELFYQEMQAPTSCYGSACHWEILQHLIQCTVDALCNQLGHENDISRHKYPNPVHNTNWTFLLSSLLLFVIATIYVLCGCGTMWMWHFVDVV